jgi:hypothetical protein
MTTDMAHFGRRKELIQLDQLTSVPVRLVLKLPNDFGKRCIGKMFGESMVLEHPDDIQSFDVDRLVLANGLGRELVKIVGPNVANPRVKFGDFQPRSVTVLRAFDLARKTALVQAQSLGGLVQTSRILKFLIVAAFGQRLKAEINADISSGLRQRLNIGFDQDADEVASRAVLTDGCADENGVIRQRTRPGDGERLFCLASLIFPSRKLKALV